VRASTQCGESHQSTWTEEGEKDTASSKRRQQQSFHVQETGQIDVGETWLILPCFPYEKIKTTTEEVKENIKVIALDLGVQTFQTGYDTTGSFHEFGKGDASRIFRLAKHLDKLLSKTATLPKERAKRKKQWRIKKAIYRARYRIQNLIVDCHWKLSNHLIDHFDAILLPKFEVSQMVEKNKRKICSKTVRQMMGWSHFQFHQRLFLKTEDRGRCKVHEVTEECTSKTCGHCGKLNHNLGSNKTFTCPHWAWTLDRDRDGVRTILIKHLELCGYTVQPLQQTVGGFGGYTLAPEKGCLQRSWIS
jgi:putative transposase